MSNFIKVKSISGFHVIRVSDIRFVSPREGTSNKSQISLLSCDIDYLLYSTETQEEIYNKILENKQL